ncbi:hypothetical protein HHK36_027174 [Tetracentron sinense]|uniref:Cytochrome b561 and DOMON domain-containing protein n=1 Tax=Tetracentron sinense TaxID=13715 RepID=A0A835D3B4_TETSI|nr:hypothetical protein HHK36_027174 [Tetracentron sinense]
MAVSIFSLLSLGFSLLLLLIPPSHSLTCSSQTFTNNKLFDHCDDLPQLSSYLHWTFDSSNSSLNIAFIAPPAKPSGWISWAINPTGTGMVGSQSLIAFRDANGSMVVNTFDVVSYKSIVQSKIAFEVSDMEAEFSDGVMRIFATVALPEKMTTLNQVWQVGGSVTDGMPGVHEFQAPNLNSKGTLDLLKGESTSQIGGDSKLKKKNIHGILNAVSWGILFPVGAMIARYLKTFKFADPAWFYLHVSCQFSAYVIGVAGWATGLQLGSQSKGVEYTGHRNIGIALFSLATLQIFALFLRPKKDHKYRIYWNVYHHGVGYVVLILGIINVFKGLEILDPAKNWKKAYIALLAVLAAISVLLEVITWIVVLKRKSDKSTKPNNGFNGADSRQQSLSS